MMIDGHQLMQSKLVEVVGLPNWHSARQDQLSDRYSKAGDRSDLDLAARSQRERYLGENKVNSP